MRPPARARAIARLLERRRGVIGVFWGNAKRRGDWTDERCLVVHVRRKRPDAVLGAERIPRRINGVRIDVIEVRRPSHHWLDHSDPFTCDDADRGRSTCSVIGKKNGVAYALLSGHGTLPVIGGELPGVYDPNLPMGVCALDPDGDRFTGDLLAGRLDDTSDTTLARMHAASSSVNGFHLAAGAYAPLRVRESPMRDDEEVAHYSSLRARHMVGRVRHVASGITHVPGFGGQTFPYRDVIVAESPDPQRPFSKKGDSGSLVVDRHRRVIGTIIGGDLSANISYVLPLDGAIRWLGARARLFFKPED